MKIENVNTQWENLILNTEERQVLAKVEHSLNFSDWNYEIGVPLEGDASELPDNYRIAAVCTDIIGKYIIENRYVPKVTNDTVTRKKHLPSFAVVLSEKKTAKTRIFDVTTKYDGISPLKIHINTHFNQEK